MFHDEVDTNISLLSHCFEPLRFSLPHFGNLTTMATSSSPLLMPSSHATLYHATQVSSPKQRKLVVNRMPSSHSFTALESTIQGDADDSDSLSSGLDDHKTTEWQTFVHLVKGYIGPGCLSLPWAVSQLGLTLGCLFIGIMACWTSYNCWTIVKMKRYIERRHQAQERHQEQLDETISEAPSTVTNATSITYPGVGEWAYGRSFQKYITVCILMQQLAICTVFLSFIGANLQAVLKNITHDGLLSSHMVVITIAVPFVMVLSFLPNLKSLAPVMWVGTLLLLASFATLGIVIGMEWSNRPAQLPEFNLAQSPLAACAILYSFEGICLILPIEAAMKRPRRFQQVFTIAMVANFFALSAVASLCVLAFGKITNGSVTAYLIETRSSDASLVWWILAANTLVSLSVLLTYPLQLFPSLELVAPWVAGMHPNNTDDDEDNDEALDNELNDFEPLPVLPEHDVVSVDFPGTAQEHRYGLVDNNEDNDTAVQNEIAPEGDQSSRQGRSFLDVALTSMTVPGDSMVLRATLVLFTYVVAVAIPNVQSLISLAGALAGSSTALLVPPVLDLAWIKQLEQEAMADDSRAPHREDDADRYRFHQWVTAYFAKIWGKWWMDRLRCYVLLLLGVVFALIGTASSIRDIVREYRGE